MLLVSKCRLNGNQNRVLMMVWYVYDGWNRVGSKEAAQGWIGNGSKSKCRLNENQNRVNHGLEQNMGGKSLRVRGFYLVVM